MTFTPEQLPAKVAALSERLMTIAKAYDLCASARVLEPQPSKVFSGERSIEVVVVKRGESTPLTWSKIVTVRRWKEIGDTIFERFIREEAVPKLNLE